MREIKFRAWVTSKVTNKSWMNHEIEFVGGKINDVFASRGGHLSDITYLQYTGSKDKNGREIYEGDILKREFEIGNTTYNPHTLGVDGYVITDSGYFIGVVRYRPSEGFILGKVRKYNDDDELIEKKSVVKIYPRYAEIIGNRFENPELLEVPE